MVAINKNKVKPAGFINNFRKNFIKFTMFANDVVKTKHVVMFIGLLPKRMTAFNSINLAIIVARSHIHGP